MNILALVIAVLVFTFFTFQVVGFIKDLKKRKEARKVDNKSKIKGEEK